MLSRDTVFLIFNGPQVLPFVTRISGAFFNVTQNLDDEKPGTRMEEAGLQSPKKGTSFPEENKGSVSAEDSCEKKHSMGNSLEDPITTKEVTYKEWYRCPGLRFHPWFIWLIQQTHEILTMVSVSWNLNTMRFGVHWTSQSSAENKATMK